MEKQSVRYIAFFLVALLLGGCGTSSASGPKATPSATPYHEPGAKFSSAPPMTINKGKRYSATVVTNRGAFVLALFPRVAPIAVNSFVFLARHHYYDNNPFTRIARDVMIQTGDPTGTMIGGPGYTFKDEPVTHRYTPGIVAMANSGRNTNGSQFFIISGPLGVTLPPKYTIFGQVIRGMNVVQRIAHTPVGQNVATSEISMPLEKVYVKTISIQGPQ